MPDKFYSKENLRFLLHEVFPLSDLCAKPLYHEHQVESLDMILDAAEDLSARELRPLLVEMDRNPPYCQNGKIHVHPKMRALMETFGEGGWINMSAKPKWGGQQVPFSVLQATGFIMAAANYDIMAYPFLTNGAAHLIESFGSEELKQTYIPNMYAGKWQGTMALSEPQAGSSLSDVVTSARPTGNGYYLIKGQKIFISCGDHDACDNVIHLMLARIEGAPAGTKGISLFVVPQRRLEDTGKLVSNDVNTAGLFHKMGYHGAPIAHLMMGERGDCRGYLVGEPHRGLSYMFQMMNEARIGVGLQASAIATAAYYYSLNYAKTRQQGRKITDKDPNKAQIPIIEHADVKRLLLFQKSIVEGSLALCMQACYYYDQWRCSEGDEKEKYFLLLELLTPVAKSYPAEMSILSTSAGLQCLGGYGFTKEYLAELFFRQTRIHTLHEGTTAIHGMDLLGRKMTMKNGQAAMLLTQEVMKEIQAAQGIASLKVYAESLQKQFLKMQEVTMHLMQVAAKEGAEIFLSDATLYLELFGILSVAWQWLKQGNVVEQHRQQAKSSYSKEFLQSKQLALQYYYEYELPKTEGLLRRLRSSNHLTVSAPPEHII